jgi:hypothetical protein
MGPDETNVNAAVSQVPPWMEPEELTWPYEISDLFLAKLREQGHQLAYRRRIWFYSENGRVRDLTCSELDWMLQMFIKSSFDDEFERVVKVWISRRSEFPSASPPTPLKVTRQLIREVRWMLKEQLLSEPPPPWLWP